MLKSDKRNKLKLSVLAMSLAAMSFTVDAAGLGKLTVLSSLGQPLRAELDITASREELASISAKLAPAETFRQQGIDYVPALAAIRFSLDKRASGQPYLRVTSDRPINEPFLDILVELSWTSGRLVREYTFLLDPADVLQKPVAAPVVAPEVKATPAAKPAEVAPAAKPAEVAAVAKPAEAERATEEAKPPAKQAEVKKVEKAEKAGAASGGRLVKQGDTLAKIAGETKPEGVNLDQMLVALLRGNTDAFDGGNMNRLRTGKILTVPDRETAAAVDQAEARKTVVAHAADFNTYRKKLAAAAGAAAPAKEEAPKQAAAGKIAPKVEDKAPALAPGKDKLEVSRTETAKDAKAAKAAQGRITALEEDLVARDRALKEANSRIAALEKNLADLKKLAELKSEQLAAMEKQAQQRAKAAEAKPPEPAPIKPVEPAKPVEPVKAAEPVKPAEAPKAAEAVKPAESVAPLEPPKPAEAPVAEAPPKPVEVAKPAEVAKKVEPAKKPVAPLPPPAPEPSFIDENPEIVFGGGGLLALLLGYFGYSAWRRKRQSAAGEPTSRITEGELTANSVFGTTGGQSVDTGGATPLHTDFSQSGMGAIDTDEGVDPVAEADVYIAYGRDAQAEEILIEALKSDPTRKAIHLKLLEIYSARKAAKQFETLAHDLHAQTGGTGPEWEKAKAMGLALDPSNPLYGGHAPAAGPTTPAMTATPPPTVVLPGTPVEKMQETVTLPGQLAHMAAAATEAPAAPATLDFDLGLGAPTPAPAATAAQAAPPAPAATAALDFDLDLGGPATAAPEAKAAPVVEAPAAFDFNLDLGGEPATAAAPVAPAAPTAGGLDFDFDLGQSAPAAPAPPAAPADIAGIGLELGAPPAAPTAPAAAADNPEVATKLELAQAYEEMGDREGARELLQEVLKEGSAAQQESARAKLAQLEA